MLTKSELIFYYYRLGFRGIYLDLFNQFVKICSIPYETLPIKRLTSDDVEAVKKLSSYIKNTVDIINIKASVLLQKDDDRVPEGSQVVAYNGVDKTTLNLSGANVLFQLNASASNALQSAILGSSVTNTSVSEKQLLSYKTVLQLREIAAKKKLRLPAKLQKKEEIVDYIYEKIMQNDDTSCVISSSETHTIEDESNTLPANKKSRLNETVISSSLVTKSSTDEEKRLLSCKTISQLKEIANHNNLRVTSRMHKDDIVSYICDNLN
jgi:hypothetical protein